MMAKIVRFVFDWKICEDWFKFKASCGIFHRHLTTSLNITFSDQRRKSTYHGFIEFIRIKFILHHYNLLYKICCRFSFNAKSSLEATDK